MPHKSPIATAKAAAPPVIVALAVAGCGQPGTPVTAAQWAKINTATRDITTACGFALQATAFPHQHPRLAHLESMARAGAVQLSDVYDHDHDQTHLYQGEPVRATVKSSIALLTQCGLHKARVPLRAALSARMRPER